MNKNIIANIYINIFFLNLPNHISKDEFYEFEIYILFRLGTCMDFIIHENDIP